MNKRTAFPIGSEVVLKSFLQQLQAPSGTKPPDDYWVLIGRKGTVISTDELDGLPAHRLGPRVLVRFDEDVEAMGLHCHNKMKNTLYIFENDLSV